MPPSQVSALALVIIMWRGARIAVMRKSPSADSNFKLKELRPPARDSDSASQFKLRRAAGPQAVPQVAVARGRRDRRPGMVPESSVTA